MSCHDGCFMDPAAFLEHFTQLASEAQPPEDALTLGSLFRYRKTRIKASTGDCFSEASFVKRCEEADRSMRASADLSRHIENGNGMCKMDLL